VEDVNNKRAEMIFIVLDTFLLCLMPTASVYILTPIYHLGLSFSARPLCDIIIAFVRVPH
jgi:hypothetical protein